MNLNQVTLAVDDINVAVDFYKTLGLIQIVSDEHYARFSFPDGDATFSIYLDEDKRGLASRGVVYFEHQDLEQLVESLKCSGQLIPDSKLGRFSAFAGGIPSL